MPVNLHTIGADSTITIDGRLVYAISGTATINTIDGGVAGQQILIIPTGVFTFGTSGNIKARTEPVVVGRAIMLQFDGQDWYDLNPGSVGGWTLNASSLSSGSGANTVGLDTGGTNPAIYAGSATPDSAPFRVTQAGALTATSATITGSVTATSGTIGGWTIGATTLSATNITLTSGAANAANITVGTGTASAGLNSASIASDIVFWAGSTFANRTTAPFRVDADGDLTATSAVITGSITATSGAIGGWDISSGAIVGRTSGTSEIRIGQTAYNTGTGFFVGNVAGTVKLSIGSGSGSSAYITWDGSDCRIRGTKFVLDGTQLFMAGTLNLGSVLFEGNIILNGSTGVIAAATELAIGVNKVVGARGAAVADADGTLASVNAQLNTLLARLRPAGHGLIAA